ncbi:probable 2-ketogluconate reductase [Dysidea avara]|uniref:probable 2-ketogluconate reductase n=1 Tax=Dysidea avara TaxID=196820 RepID=UPI00332AE5A9
MLSKTTLTKTCLYTIRRIDSPLRKQFCTASFQRRYAMNATETHYVYQDGPMDREDMQKELNGAFNIVMMEALEACRSNIVAMCATSVNKPVTGQLMESLPALKVISCLSTGYDHVDVQAATRLGIRVGYTPYVFDDATADGALALLLSCSRRVVEGDKISRNPSTLKYPGYEFLVQEVSHSTIGIVGMGRIGSKIAKRASKGFDMKVVYHSRRQKSAEEEHAVCATYVPVLNELLQQCDFVVLAAPSTKETYRMMGREQFKVMKKTGIFINIARGALVDHDALVEALRDGEIAHAGLDVTDPEPLPRDHPLLTMNNVTFTPHIGGNTYTASKKAIDITIANILAGMKGEALVHEV